MFKHAIRFCIIIVLSNIISVTSAYTQEADTLRLKQFLQSILLAHPVLQSAAFERNIADAELQSALGGFDPVLRSQYELKYEGWQATPDRINHFSAGIEMPLNTLFGPKISAGFDRGIGSSINSEDRTSLAGQGVVGISLPLWSGVATDRRRTNFGKAQLRPLLADANQRFEQNNLLRAAGLQYWHWAEASEQLRVTEDVLALALQRAAYIAARARRGEVAALDSVEALQEVERRRGENFRARRILEQANIDASVYLWTETGIPRALTQSPQSLPALPNVDSLQIRIDRERAMTMRPELQRLDFTQQSTSLDINLARESQKPLIEAKTQWLYYPGSSNNDNLKVGFDFMMPLFFRTASAQTELLTISLERTRLQTAQTSRFINAEIDNAISALQRAAERLDAADKETRFAVQMEEGERKRFLAGETSLLIVNLRERAAAEARTRMISARADYLRAWVLYLWSIGSISQLTQ